MFFIKALIDTLNPTLAQDNSA